MTRLALASLSAILVAVVATANPTVFQSPYGFQFEVPSGWKASPLSGKESTVVVYREQVSQMGQTEGFTVRTCPQPSPWSCLEGGFRAVLLKSSPTRLAGLPAKEYVFERETASKTRLWWEVVTVVSKRDKTYAVIGRFPSLDSQEYWKLYDQVRRSFRITD